MAHYINVEIQRSVLLTVLSSLITLSNPCKILTSTTVNLLSIPVRIYFAGQSTMRKLVKTIEVRILYRFHGVKESNNPVNADNMKQGSLVSNLCYSWVELYLVIYCCQLRNWGMYLTHPAWRALNSDWSANSLIQVGNGLFEVIRRQGFASN